MQKISKFSPGEKIMAAVFGLLIIFGLIVNAGIIETTPYSSLPAAAKTERAIVFNNPWNGSVSQVVQYLQKVLNDPGSLEIIQWSKVTKITNKKGEPFLFMVRCKYRAKNYYGGYVVQEKLFEIDGKGNITKATDI